MVTTFVNMNDKMQPVGWLRAMIDECAATVPCFSAAHFSTDAPLELLEDDRVKDTFGNRFQVTLADALHFWLEFDLDEPCGMPLCSEFGVDAKRPGELRHPYDYAEWPAGERQRALALFISALVRSLASERHIALPAEVAGRPSQQRVDPPACVNPPPAPAPVWTQAAALHDLLSVKEKRCADNCCALVVQTRKDEARNEAHIRVLLPVRGVNGHCDGTTDDGHKYQRGVPKKLPLVHPSDGVAVLRARYYWEWDAERREHVVKRHVDIKLSRFLKSVMFGRSRDHEWFISMLDDPTKELLFLVTRFTSRAFSCIDKGLRRMGYRLRALNYTQCLLRSCGLAAAPESTLGDANGNDGLYRLSADGLLLHLAGRPDLAHLRLKVCLTDNYFVPGLGDNTPASEMIVSAYNKDDSRAESSPRPLEHDYPSVFLPPHHNPKKFLEFKSQL